MTRVRRSRVVVAVVAVAATSSACTDHGDLAGGVYVLRAVGDSQLPLVRYNAGGDVTMLVADTLVLDGSGRARRATTDRSQGPSGPSSEATTLDAGSYSVHGTTVDIAWVCAARDRAAAAPRLALVPERAAASQGIPFSSTGDPCVYPEYALSGNALTTFPRQPDPTFVARHYERVAPLPRVP